MVKKRKSKEIKFWFEDADKEPDLRITPLLPMRAEFQPFRIKFNIRMPRISTGLPIAISQTKDKLIVRATLKGYRKKDISIRVTQRMLEISARRKKEKIIQRKGLYKEERKAGEVRRVMSLPASVDPSRTRSTFRNGILEIVMPKLKKQ